MKIALFATLLFFVTLHFGVTIRDILRGPGSRVVVETGRSIALGAVVNWAMMSWLIVAAVWLMGGC